MGSLGVWVEIRHGWDPSFPHGKPLPSLSGEDKEPPVILLPRTQPDCEAFCQTIFILKILLFFPSFPFLFGWCKKLTSLLWITGMSGGYMA